MDERTMVYLDDVVKVIYQALRTPVPDYHKDPFHDSMGVAMAMANEIPPAQPERKKGEWKCSDDMYETGICTHCGWDTEEPWEECKKRYLYCPHCGDRKR